MTTAAIYARYSTEHQNDRSVEDQIALCERFAERQGLTVTARHADRAMSGSRYGDRPGLMALLAEAKAGRFGAIIVEHGDRLSRHPGDIHAIREAMEFSGVAILQVDGGELDTLKASVSGLVSAMTLQGLKVKVRRGMEGVVAEGRSAGGRAYGYRPVKGEPGRLSIVEAEACIIRRIFSDYISGSSARTIAGRLNAERIPAPRGTRWSASAIGGWGQRGNGIIGNELYAGMLVWNKVRMVRHPETRRRISRPNPPEAWRRRAAPELAIIDAATWTAAQARRQGRRDGVYVRQPRTLLSGLLACPDCGGSLVIKDRQGGRVRIHCSTMRESAACGNRRVLNLNRIEAAVIAGLASHLEAPDLVAEYARAYNTERTRLARDLAGGRQQAQARLLTIAGDIDRAVSLMITGVVSAAVMAPRVRALEAEKLDLEQRLAALEPRVIGIRTGALARYREQLADLARSVTEAGQEAVDAFRALVGRVTVHPDYRVAVTASLAPLIDVQGLYAGSGRPINAETPTCCFEFTVAA